MSKRTGYQVKITGFIVASPTDMEAMRAAIIKIDALCTVMSEDGREFVVFPCGRGSVMIALDFIEADTDEDEDEDEP